MTFGKIVGHDTRRGRRAVASHSKNDPSNPASFSRYIRNEGAMHHLERKEAILPCGYKVRESWAALRRSWQGFKIAHSIGDMARKRHYATFIHKVQQEMGIALTPFEPGLVDEQETTTSEGALETNSAEGESTTIADTNIEWGDENLPNFEEMMSTVAGNTEIPDPREEIFAKYEDRSQSSCEYPDQDERDKMYTDGASVYPSRGMFATYEDRFESSCDYDYYENNARKVAVETHLVHPENSCRVDPEFEAHKLQIEKKRQLHSCFYKSNHVPFDDADST